MSMLKDDNFNDSPKMKLKFATTCVISSLAVLIVLMVVFLSNAKNSRSRGSAAKKAPETNSSFTVSENEEQEEEYLTADDLNFWHAYDPDKTPSAALPGSGYDRDNSSRRDDRREKPEDEKPSE